MKRIEILVIALLAVSMLLAACTPDDMIIPETNSTASPTENGGSQVVIEYRREGGLTGKAEAFTIYADGTLEREDGTTRLLDPAQLDAALTAVDAAGFFDLSIPASTGVCNDCYTYIVTVNYDGKTNTITAVDNGELPQAFWSVLDEIAKLAAETV